MIANSYLAFLSLTVTANELFLQERASTKSSTAKKNEQFSDSSLNFFTPFNVNIGEALSYVGIENFACGNPIIDGKNFTVKKLQGSWFQTYASRSTDVYGCLEY